MNLSLLRQRATSIFHLLIAGAGLNGFTVSANPRKVIAADGHELLTYHLARNSGLGAGGRSRASVFYVQGSSDRSVLRAMHQLAGFVMMDMRVILVERRGVLAEGNVNELVARKHATKGRRVQDMLDVIGAYLGDAASGTPVILLGVSEGGDVAASVAVQEPRVTHLALAGMGGWSQAEELKHFVRQRGHYLGIDSVAELDAKLEEIRARPDSDEIWLGHPFRRWNAYAWDAPVHDLLRLDIPILLAHGASDDSVPVESARAISEAMTASGRENLRYCEYATLDHSFRDVRSGKSGLPLVELDAVRWLAETGVLSAAGKLRFEDRVRANHPEWF